MTGPTPLKLDEYAKRRACLMQRIGPQGVAVIPAAREVVRNRDVHFRFRQDSDFLYLTGFNEPEAIAILAPDRAEGEFVLFVRPRDPAREIWDGRRAGPEGAVGRYGADQAFPLDQFDRRLPQMLEGREHVHHTLGEHAWLDPKLAACVREIRDLSRRGPSAPDAFVALEATLHEMRLIKTAPELERIRFACGVSAQAHVRAMRYARPGVYEWQVAAEIHHEFERHRMEPGYGSIVGGGDNACILHYVDNDAVLRDGDLLLIDAGGECQGYTADITRTFPVNGTYSGPQRAVYDVVLRAQLAAIAELRPGNPCSRAHEAATRVLTEGMVELGLLSGDVDTLIAEDKHKRFFMHGTGHWLGMDVHDVGRYKRDGEARPFAAGMLMTVEPGLYIAPDAEGVDPQYRGIGVRVEDDVLVTEQGPEVLTDGVAKTPEEVEALMAAARS